MTPYHEEYKQISQKNEENLGRDTSSRKTQVCLYSDPTHFIFELLQNADDYGATEIAFTLYADRLEVEHNGVAFTWEHVRFITYIGESTSKNDPIKEGRFGLGFKSVFAFTATPRVYSDDKCFEIYGLYKVRPLERPTDLRPDFTRFSLPFNHREHKPDYIEEFVDPDDAFNRIAAKLQKPYMMSLLFTRNLKTIRWRINTGSDCRNGEYWRHDESLPSDANFRVRRTVLADGTTRMPLMIFARPVIWNGEQQKPVEVAFSLNERARIVESHENLVVLFPTKEDTHLRFIVNGPYQTNPPRETVFWDRDYNKHLMQETAALLQEAIPYIKRHGLLGTDFLSVLPIDDDGIPESFAPLSTTIRETFKSEPLVPTNDGGFAPATGLVQGPKAIREVITDSLFPIFSQSESRWAAGVMLNSRAERFLRSLDIPSWSWSQLDTALHRLLVLEPGYGCLEGQKDDWMRRFYQLLYLLIHDEGLGENVRDWRCIRTASDQHVRGLDAYFPDLDNPRDWRGFHLVKTCLLKTKSLRTNQRANIRYVLEKAGVSDLTEGKQIKQILASYYGTDTGRKSLKKPMHLRHMRRFVKYAREHDASMFQGHVLFWHQDGGALRHPSEFFLDTPFTETGLREWYGATDTNPPLRLSLWDGYSASVTGITEFAQKLGAADSLRPEKVSTADNPSSEELHGDDRYIRKTDTGAGRRVVVDTDYTIPGVEHVLGKNNRELNHLVWNAMCSADSACLKARYGRSMRNERTVASTIVHILRKAQWIPDKAGNFRKPQNMTAEDLTQGFHFDDDNGWLTAIEFGQDARRHSKGDLMRQEAADQLGITSPILKLVELLNCVPDARRNALIEKCTQLATETRKRDAVSVDDIVVDSERRQKKIEERLAEAPLKQYEKRERSVRVSQDPGKRDVDVLLRSWYTEHDLLYCQICRQVMPFKKRNGQYYFERVEAFDLPKEDEANNLALCPICAAKYNEFLRNGPREAWKDLRARLLNSQQPVRQPEIQLTLGDEHTSIRFVKTHYLDLKSVLAILQSG